MHKESVKVYLHLLNQIPSTPQSIMIQSNAQTPKKTQKHSKPSTLDYATPIVIHIMGVKKITNCLILITFDSFSHNLLKSHQIMEKRWWSQSKVNGICTKHMLLSQFFLPTCTCSSILNSF